MTVYELINPSDTVTFEADSFLIASLATILVGEGQYAAKAVGGSADQNVPFFMFGTEDDLQQWFYERFKVSMGQELFKQYAQPVATCLDSFVYGNREDYLAAQAAITDEDKRKQNIAEWDDRHRTSMNQLVKRARMLANNIRKADAVQPT
jgi:hypothetical protein